MAVAVPKRRTAPAPPPARTTPPKRRAPRPRKAAASGAVAVPAPSRAPSRRPARKPVRKAPARSPQRARPKARRSPGARVIPFAGRTAVAVRDLPDSGLMVRMTRGRAWIAVLGALLVGIVALNVVNLSFSASAARIDQQISALDSENGILQGRAATRGSTERVRAAGAGQGLTMPSSADIAFVDFNRDTIATAASRLAAASP
jgi:hypothetical protein